MSLLTGKLIKIEYHRLNFEKIYQQNNQEKDQEKDHISHLALRRQEKELAAKNGDTSKVQKEFLI